MRRTRTILCALVMALALTVQAVAFTDTEGHWAETSIERWSGYGLVNGYTDGSFGPDKPLTRSEMAAILCRLMGWQEQAENSFADLDSQSWQADYILRANAAGVILGDGTSVRPDDSITRQEAAVMLYRALYLEENRDGAPAFTDSEQIAAWAQAQVDTLAGMGCINGMGDGSFQPLENVTRAQVLTILDRAVAACYDRAGAFSGNAAGTVIVRAPGVTLQNMTIEGDLILTSTAVGSETTLSNVRVTGRLIVLGQELQTVELMGESSVSEIRVMAGKVLVNAGESASVGGVTICEAGARITGIPVGTPVTVEESAGEGYVNGHLVRAGAEETAQEGTDINVGIEIEVDIEDGGESGGPAPIIPTTEAPEVLSRTEDSVTVRVYKGTTYILTDAAGTVIGTYEAEEDGEYTFGSLAWGHYYLTAEQPGLLSSEPVSVYISDGSLIIDWSEAQ